MKLSGNNGLRLGLLPQPRQSARVGLAADIVLRRAGRGSYRVQILDLSPHGCRAEIIERPRLHEMVWVKFEGLTALAATVCWTREFDAGFEFERPIHPAVFELLLSRMARAPAAAMIDLG